MQNTFVDDVAALDEDGAGCHGRHAVIASMQYPNEAHNGARLRLGFGTCMLVQLALSIRMTCSINVRKPAHAHTGLWEPQYPEWRSWTCFRARPCFLCTPW